LPGPTFQQKDEAAGTDEHPALKTAQFASHFPLTTSGQAEVAFIFANRVWSTRPSGSAQRAELQEHLPKSNKSPTSRRLERHNPRDSAALSSQQQRRQAVLVNTQASISLFYWTQSLPPVRNWVG